MSKEFTNEQQIEIKEKELKVMAETLASSNNMLHDLVEENNKLANEVDTLIHKERIKEKLIAQERQNLSYLREQYKKINKK